MWSHDFLSYMFSHHLHAFSHKNSKYQKFKISPFLHTMSFYICVSCKCRSNIIYPICGNSNIKIFLQHFYTFLQVIWAIISDFLYVITYDSIRFTSLIIYIYNRHLTDKTTEVSCCVLIHNVLVHYYALLPSPYTAKLCFRSISVCVCVCVCVWHSIHFWCGGSSSPYLG